MVQCLLGQPISCRGVLLPRPKNNKVVTMATWKRYVYIAFSNQVHREQKAQLLHGCLMHHGGIQIEQNIYLADRHRWLCQDVQVDWDGVCCQGCFSLSFLHCQFQWGHIHVGGKLPTPTHPYSAQRGDKGLLWYSLQTSVLQINGQGVHWSLMVKRCIWTACRWYELSCFSKQVLWHSTCKQAWIGVSVAGFSAIDSGSEPVTKGLLNSEKKILWFLYSVMILFTNNYHTSQMH